MVTAPRTGVSTVATLLAKAEVASALLRAEGEEEKE
jgi:hypothetical protein